MKSARNLGPAGWGEVYLAEDTVLRRKVALKLLPSDLVENRERLGRFEQEALTASALNHPNILTVYEFGEAGSARFIATEYVDGKTLRQHLKGPQLSVREAIDVASQIASALAAAHKAGIVHRDIKPENIMLRRDGIVKVLDFGLAKLTGPQSEAVDTEAATRALFRTDPGIVVGTAAYVSPEQARGQETDARTDIFSLGTVVFEMVAGCLPFHGTTTSELLAAILNEKEQPPLARFARDVPSELEHIVSKALRKDREYRYQTIKDFLIDLQDLRRDLEVQVQLQRTFPPELRDLQTNSPSKEQTVVLAHPVHTVGEATSRGTSSAEYIVGQAKRDKQGAAAGLVAIILLSVAGD